MDSKKKLFMSVCALCLMAVSSLVSIAAVLAWTGQSVASSIVVKYSASQVAGTVTANYIVGNTSTAMKTPDGTKTTLTFTGSEPGDVQNDALVPAGDITLSTTNNYVVFEYVFTNASATYAYPIKLVYSDTGVTDTNMEVSVITAGTKIETANLGTASWVTASGTTLVQDTTTVPASSTGFYVYVKVAVGSTVNDATYSGDYTWTLGTL